MLCPEINVTSIRHMETSEAHLNTSEVSNFNQACMQLTPITFHFRYQLTTYHYLLLSFLSKLCLYPLPFWIV
jgi:hypothetical protein